MLRRTAIVLIALSIALPAAAARLPKGVTPTHYSITFVPDLQNEKFSGEETIAVKLASTTRTITFNSVDLTVDDASVTAGGHKLIPSVSTSVPDQTITLYLPQAAPAGTAQIHLRFRGDLSKKLRGLYLSKTERRKYAVTQFEATYARRAFPSFDEPAMKATFDISVVADDGDTAISNAPIAADTPGPGDKKHTIRFSTSPKMSTYLVALAVGDFKCREGAADGIPIRSCSVPEKYELTRFALEAAEKELPLFNRYYGVKYPFKKLDLIAFPDFEAGAMENTAAITFRESAMLLDDKAPAEARRGIASVVSHEMAHQWFGDLVTPGLVGRSLAERGLRHVGNAEGDQAVAPRVGN